MGSKPSGISGSRAASVLGISGYKTKLAVWQEIIEEQIPGWNASHGFLLPEQEVSAAMRWGTAFENTIAKLTAKHFKHKVTNCEVEFSNETLSKIPITCHIDGMINGMLYEAKTTSSYNFNAAWGNHNIPDYYQAQVQHNLLLTGLEKAVVVCLEFPKAPEQWENNGARIEDNFQDKWGKILYEMGFFHVYEIAADKAQQKSMIQAYKEFAESIEAKKMPEPDNFDDIKRIFPSPKGILVVSDEIAMKIFEYQTITKSLGSTGPLAKRQEELKIEILSYAQKYSNITSESTESLVIKNKEGLKLGSFGKNKAGTLIFRT